MIALYAFAGGWFLMVVLVLWFIRQAPLIEMEAETEEQRLRRLFLAGIATREYQRHIIDELCNGLGELSGRPITPGSGDARRLVIIDAIYGNRHVTFESLKERIEGWKEQDGNADDHTPVAANAGQGAVNPWHYSHN